MLHRDALLDILGKFMHTETTTKHDPITGAPSTTTTLLFPRYHQWEVVTALGRAARTEQFGNEEFTQGQQHSFVQSALTVLLENETLFTQAAKNTGKQFSESPDLRDELLTSLADNSGVHQKITDFFFSDSPGVDAMIGTLALAYHALVQQRLQAGPGAAQDA